MSVNVFVCHLFYDVVDVSASPAYPRKSPPRGRRGMGRVHGQNDILVGWVIIQLTLSVVGPRPTFDILSLNEH